METTNEQILKVDIISTINMMRTKIGINQSDFDFLFKKSIAELEEIRDSTILHYNQAIKNSKNLLKLKTN